MEVEQIIIPICPGVKLLIYSSNSPLFDDEYAVDYAESRWQLQEGKEYEYEFLDDSLNEPVDWYLEGEASMIKRNPRHNNRGIITTGLYVGTAHLKAVKAIDKDIVPVNIEIQSVKTSYRSDYRQMLSDITNYYTDLVMQQGSPVTQTFEVDYSTPQNSLYQKFAFVKSIVEDEQFDEAIHKILSNPVRRWAETTIERHIESVKKFSKNSLRQIITRKDRVHYSGEIKGIDSLPRYLTVSHKIDSIDTPENQFVKYVLTSFYGFCSSLGNKEHATPQLCIEIDSVCNKLASYLNGLFFKDISNPSQLNIASPVLQRKEGYREILQAWLKFDLAAKITWMGGDAVYAAGKRNIAILYEYWLFFKLMECVSEIFEVPAVEKKCLIRNDEDGISLELRQGHVKMIHGSTMAGNRQLNITLYYNRTFSHTNDIYSSGSWTMNMRPDYTLSIWPGSMTEDEAEHEDAIVHIHFDAKYRLNRIIIEDKELPFRPGEEELPEELQKEFQKEKEDREIDIYKRGDLLKMHAYKDAIRRTGGAYVLYPGTEKKIKKGFHEIIPGLGAFCIAPGHEEEQIPALKRFLKDVVNHFMNRTSQREKVAIAEHEIYSSSPIPFYELFPEPYGTAVFPDAVKVIIGSYKNESHLKWIIEKGKYSICISNSLEESIDVSDSYLNAKYLLLYDSRDLSVNSIMKMIRQKPIIMTDKAISKIGYPQPQKDHLYLVYEVSKDSVETELKERQWDISSLITKKGESIVVTYTNLFQHP